MNVIQPLIELQEVDGRIRELEREAKDIPRRKALESARLAGVNAALEIAKNHVEALRRRVNEDEAEAEQIREKVRGLKTAQLNIKSNKEMQQSIIQIESLEHEAEAAENRALALQGDEMPTLEARVRNHDLAPAGVSEIGAQPDEDRQQRKSGGNRVQQLSNVLCQL